MRRIVRAAYLGEKLGDTSALENPASLDEIKRSRRSAASKFSAHPFDFAQLWRGRQGKLRRVLLQNCSRSHQHVVWNRPPTASVCASLL